MVLVSSADHTSASTTVHDRGKPSRAKPDERRSVQTFEAQAQRRGVPGDAREWHHTHAQRAEGRGASGAGRPPDHAQRTRGSARGRANSSSRQRKPLTNQGTTLRRRCGYGARGARLTHSQRGASTARKRKSAVWVNTTRLDDAGDKKPEARSRTEGVFA